MAPKWLFSLIFVGFYCGLRFTVAQDVKIWAANTNFNNPRNWRGGKLPCPNDRVIFPASSPVLVYMPESFSVSEVVLPLNGELVFPTNAIFNVTGKTETASCVGQDLLFQPSVEFWYNPDNWNLTSDRMFPESHPRRNKAVPHAYQIPCRWDRVQFPAQSSFSVQGIEPPVSIASLQINGRIYSQPDLDALLETPTGKLLFHNNPSIQITNSLCTDPKGCICGNERDLIFYAICKFKPCPDLMCLDPIEVVGHCCLICGAKLTAKYDSNFRMQRFLELHQNLHSNELFDRVDSFTSRISENEVQTVFVDYTDTNYVANKLAQLMNSIYKADVNSIRSYGISSIDFQKSERFQAQPPASDQQSSSSGMSPGGVAALVISIFICLGLGAAFYIYRKRQLDGFSFARFDLRSDKIELELGTTPHDELEPEETPPPPPATSVTKDESKGFDNPIYGTNVTSEASSDTEESSEVRDFVENPMFKLFEESE
ncbi:protein amnionless-like [Argiope bruennichi]|uniref:protein amnionless-like n=1 Tax=Argiope bruennichi TaxID=94029 RepID=UPI002493E5DF|nr:protein amnionless-like [Argiope bruennichi]